jgi:hypothetical protein
VKLASIAAGGGAPRSEARRAARIQLDDQRVAERRRRLDIYRVSAVADQDAIVDRHRSAGRDERVTRRAVAFDLQVAEKDVAVADADRRVKGAGKADPHAVRGVVIERVALDAGIVAEALPGAGRQGDRVAGVGGMTRQGQEGRGAGKFAVVVAIALVAVAVGDEVGRQ